MATTVGKRATLGTHAVITMVGVKDLSAAARFYEETLGLTRFGPENPEVVTFRSGGSSLNVYRSEYAGTNRATTALWVIGDDLEAIVADLRDKGVKFEHYDLPEMQRKGDVHVAGDLRVAWFKDPDGNILSLSNL
jgi:catechol 2,3-dioxygenase-like lactoylglutathione lyase family enzyme